MNLSLHSMALDLPRVADHPNRAPFRGVLTLLDVPSDRPPSGAHGHRVLLTRAAAEAALPSLLGMGLDYAPALDRHDVQRKVGIITEANVIKRVEQGAREQGTRVEQGFSPADKIRKAMAASAAAVRAVGRQPSTVDCIQVSGYLFARDFPDVVRQIRTQTEQWTPAASGRNPHPLGMSYEITDARIDDLRASVWTVTECTFTGAAVLRRDKAAYGATWIELQ